MLDWLAVGDSLAWAWDYSPLMLGFLGGIIKGIGKVAGKLAPVASMIPGVGTVAGAALGAGGNLLAGKGLKGALQGAAMGAIPGAIKGVGGLATKLGAGKALAGAATSMAGGAAGAAGGGEAGKGGGLWDTVGKVATIGGGIFDAAQESKRNNADIRYNDARIALEKEGLGISRDRLGEDRRQFDGTLGLNRDKLGEDTRQFNEKFGLEKSQFEKEKETEQFGRARNTRFAKVRAPFVTGLMAGRTLDKDPEVQRRLGKVG